MGLCPIVRRIHSEDNVAEAFAEQYKSFLVTLITGMKHGTS